MTCAHTIIIASLITGFTFPGMIDDPGWTAGSEISKSPEVGPLPSQRMSFAIFISATAVVRTAVPAGSVFLSPPALADGPVEVRAPQAVAS